MSKYSEASIKAHEYGAKKIHTELQRNSTLLSTSFRRLTEEIENWELYLTEKQKEVAYEFLKCLSTTEVDRRLKLTEGSTYHRLFGSTGKSLGAYGRLKQVQKMLKEYNDAK